MEGESNDVVEQMSRSGQVTRHTLPYSVRLEDFEIDTYPGTMRPAQFRSRFQIVDPQAGSPISAAVWMNNPYSYRGYTFFQSSYQQSGGREASIFSVSKDPGQPIAFTGYVLLVVGMIIVLATRIGQSSKRAALERELLGGPGKTAAAILAILLAGTASAAERCPHPCRAAPARRRCGRGRSWGSWRRSGASMVSGSAVAPKFKTFGS